MKILIVENDEDSRVYLERALTSQNYTVESAGNGVLAIEKALLSPPDMIISDIMMPEMDGFDFCRKVKANEKLQHIPFIFYTATFIDKKDEELAMSLDASRFIVKPIEMQEFFKIITDVIEEHKENKLPVPGKALVEKEKTDEMYSETIARKLDKKMAELQKEIAEHKQTEEELEKYHEHLEELVKERTIQLNEKNEELERFNKLFVGRELRMIELKKEIAELKKAPVKK
jgi:response regulator RpfG family c-di-GMP phosphodiesterase